MKEKSIKFYNLAVRVINKKKLEKVKEDFADLTTTQGQNILAQMEQALESNGKVYAYYHKKKVAGVYVFAREELTEDEKTKHVYCLKVRYIAGEYEQFTEKMDKSIQEEIKEQALFQECEYIIWQDENLEKSKIQAISGSGIAIGISLGVMYGVVFDDLAMGLSLGLCFGLCYSMIFANAKKKK